MQDETIFLYVLVFLWIKCVLADFWVLIQFVLILCVPGFPGHLVQGVSRFSPGEAAMDIRPLRPEWRWSHYKEGNGRGGHVHLWYARAKYRTTDWRYNGQSSCGQDLYGESKDFHFENVFFFSNRWVKLAEHYLKKQYVWWTTNFTHLFAKMSRILKSATKRGPGQVFGFKLGNW